jgi:hypothetical protein
MRTVRDVLIVALACLLLAMGAHAQMCGMMRPPSIQGGVWGPVVGTGAAYEMQDNKQKQTMEITIVGKETVNGKDAY